MIRRSIAKYIGYSLQDYIRKTDTLGTLSFLRESQFWDEMHLEEYRLNKLKNLVDFAAKNVPYYQNLFKSIKLKAFDIKRLEDINKIPVLTKEIVRKENMNLVASNFNMKYVKKGKTGGTTGSPIVVFKDVNNRSFTWASYYRWFDWMGVNYFDKAANFWGARSVLSVSYRKKIIDRTVNYLQNNLAFNSFNMGENDLPTIYNKLKKHKPVIIKGYLSALLILANYLETNSLDNIKPKVISSTSEMLLTNNRKYLEKIFGAPIYDQYGCGELSAIAYECSEHKGLHINQEHIICEILDDDNKFITGKPGRVVGTDLDNYVMPFIRYDCGDLATYADFKCTCGVNQPLLTSIDGRETDTIMLSNGRKVHGVFFIDIFFELEILTDKIKRFQVYQACPGEIEFRYEKAGEINVKILNELIAMLHRYFSKVDFIEVKHLPIEPNGKFKYIVNEIKEQ